MINKFSCNDPLCAPMFNDFVLLIAVMNDRCLGLLCTRDVILWPLPQRQVVLFQYCTLQLSALSCAQMLGSFDYVCISMLNVVQCCQEYSNHLLSMICL